jgi:hypothetical protein
MIACSGLIVLLSPPSPWTSRQFGAVTQKTAYKRHTLGTSRGSAIEALRAFHEERLRIGASIVAYGRRLGEMLTAKVSTET